MLAPKKLLAWDKAASLDYAARWCSGGNDCPSGQYSGIDSDCTHFACHVLAAGKVIVTGQPPAQCAKGLCYRVKDLDAWCQGASATYANVSQITSVQADKGDLVFLTGFRWRDFEFNTTHVMMVAGPVSSQGSAVFAHTNQRCGNEAVEYKVADAKFFRIDPAFADGTWRSTDPGQRFELKIAGPKVRMTEFRAGGGASASRDLELQNDAAAGATLSRKVDDEVLRVQDFSNAGLRAAILAAQPADSTLSLEFESGAIVAKWTGLLVKKKPDGSFQEIVPRAQTPVKLFSFKRV